MPISKTYRTQKSVNVLVATSPNAGYKMMLHGNRTTKEGKNERLGGENH